VNCLDGTRCHDRPVTSGDSRPCRSGRFSAASSLTRHG
jgi:hypothetical protein